MTDKLDLQSPDFVTENIEKIAALFPNCVTETDNGKAIDFDLLRQELNHNIIEGTKERYRLEWPGKREAIVTANLPTTNTLRPVPEESVDFENTENLYIEGDNLEALKILQESYLGKIKMIAIDPPYNTGNDFVYKDNFTEDKTEHEEESGQRDEMGRRLVPNPESSGRYHSDWLTMMYPRLKLARNLLADDGVIFISIDDNEVHNIRKVCDEVFGESNFESEISWRRRHNQPNDKTKIIAKVSEFILVYAKSSILLKEKDTFYGLPLSEGRAKDYKNPDNDINGPWSTNPWKAAIGRGGSFYKITTPTGIEYEETWYGNEDTFKQYLAQNRVYWTDSGNGYPRIKIYLKDANEKGQSLIDFITHDKFGNNQEASAELENLMGRSGLFDNPKPVKLIKAFVNISTKKSDIILDFFSGSATTAQAVMQLNAEDGGNRKFIMVQLPEKTDEQSEAFKADYKNICEIGKERIRRAGKKIKEELEAKQKTEAGKLNFDNPGNPDNPKNQGSDFGFRVYKLDSSNMHDVYYRPQDYKQTTLDLFADNVKPGRTAMDLVTQVMLDWGLPLSLKIAETKVSGKQVFKVAGNSLFACFDNGIDEAFAKEIAKEQPLRIVFRDSSFVNDTAKENVKQLLKQLSPETEMRVI